MGEERFHVTHLVYDHGVIVTGREKQLDPPWLHSLKHCNRLFVRLLHESIVELTHGGIVSFSLGFEHWGLSGGDQVEQFQGLSHDNALLVADLEDGGDLEHVAFGDRNRTGVHFRVGVAVLKCSLRDEVLVEFVVLRQFLKFGLGLLLQLGLVHCGLHHIFVAQLEEYQSAFVIQIPDLGVARTTHCY